MDAFQQATAVITVMGVLIGSLWLLRQRGIVSWRGLARSNQCERKLQVVERVQLSPQHCLCLVRIEHRTLLIGTSPSDCRVLTEDPRP